MMSTLPTIGWREWIALPELGIPALKMKTDTGARTSCLHVDHFEIYEKDRKHRVKFGAQPIKRRPETGFEADLPLADEKAVRSSTGHLEVRPYIQTTMILGGVEYPILFSLTKRDRMKFRMLLGRVAMKNRFLVDPSREYLQGKFPT